MKIIVIPISSQSTNTISILVAGHSKTKLSRLSQQLSLFLVWTLLLLRKLFYWEKNIFLRKYRVLITNRCTDVLNCRNKFPQYIGTLFIPYDKHLLYELLLMMRNVTHKILFSRFGQKGPFGCLSWVSVKEGQGWISSPTPHTHFLRDILGPLLIIDSSLFSKKAK